jgi:hypothetical protein
MYKLLLILIALISPIFAAAADKWVPVTAENTAGGPLLLNIGNIQVNGNGNRVATIRSNASKGFRMDIVTEFDCALRRTRSLSSAVTDKEGHLITASGPQDRWFSEEQSVGLGHICRNAMLSPGGASATLEIDIKNEIDLKDGTYLVKEHAGQGRYAIITHYHGRFEGGDFAQAKCTDQLLASKLSAKLSALQINLKATDYLLTKCNEVPYGQITE